MFEKVVSDTCRSYVSKRYKYAVNDAKKKEKGGYPRRTQIDYWTHF